MQMRSIQSIPVRGPMPNVEKFIDYVKDTYGVDASYRNKSFTFTGNTNDILDLVADMFAVDGEMAVTMM